MYKKKIVLNKEFFRNKYFKKKKKAYVFFHSYELIFALYLFFYFVGMRVIGLGFVLGMWLHLLMDISANGWNWRSYFFFYRLMKGFRIRDLR